VNANRRNKILSAGLLGNLVSGMFFGVGCLIVEHIDNKWFSTEENAPKEATVKPKVAVGVASPLENRESTPPSNGKLPNSKHLAQKQSSD
jgi:hypothetical protein